MFTYDSFRDAVARFRRPVAVLLSLAFVSTFAIAGCNTTPKIDLPKVVKDDPTSQELLDAVNANVAKIRSFHTTNGRISEKSYPGGATCSISYRETNHFRLAAAVALHGRAIDCGSNDSKFWYWNSLVNDACVFTCDVNKFQGSVLSQEFPLDPSWFPEALGIVRISPDDVVEGPYVDTSDSKRIALRIKRKRADGVYTEKLVFEPRTAAIVRQEIRNPAGQNVVVVTCKEHQLVGEENAVLPKRLEVRCPAGQMVFTIDLGTPVLNDDSKLMDFNPPNDLRDARFVDLSADGANSSSANRSSVNPPTTSPSTSSSTTSSSSSSPSTTNATSASEPAVLDASTLNGGALGSSPADNQSIQAPQNTSSGIVPFPNASNHNSARLAQSAPPTHYYAQENPAEPNDAYATAFNAPASNSNVGNDYSVASNNLSNGVSNNLNNVPNNVSASPNDFADATIGSREQLVNETSYVDALPNIEQPAPETLPTFSAPNLDAQTAYDATNVDATAQANNLNAFQAQPQANYQDATTQANDLNAFQAQQQANYQDATTQANNQNAFQAQPQANYQDATTQANDLNAFQAQPQANYQSATTQANDLNAFQAQPQANYQDATAQANNANAFQAQPQTNYQDATAQANNQNAFQSQSSGTPSVNQGRQLPTYAQRASQGPIYPGLTASEASRPINALAPASTALAAQNWQAPTLSNGSNTSNASLDDLNNSSLPTQTPNYSSVNARATNNVATTSSAGATSRNLASQNAAPSSSIEPPVLSEPVDDPSEFDFPVLEF